MIQTWALFVDAYRELSSKKLFWFVLALSGILVLCMACIGISTRGLTILVWDVPVSVLNTSTMNQATFYRLMFFTLGIAIWLSWAATILALISTAGIFPDFLAGGSIELTLSKPIGRYRLFFTKYITGLLFVALQVSLFTLASFVLIGLRGKVWDTQLFWAIPLVLLVFSYLYCFSVLVALLTRSTMAALLLSLLLWCIVFLVNLADGVVLQFKVRTDRIVALQQAEADATTSKLDAARAEGHPADEQSPAPAEPVDAPAEADGTKARERAEKLEAELARWTERLDSSRRDQRILTRAHAIVFAVKTVLPKTGETVDLLRRKLVKNTEMEKFEDQAAASSPRGGIETVDGVKLSNRSVQKEIQREMESRSVGWVVGTSLAFEAVILAIAGWIFSRRDF